MLSKRTATAAALLMALTLCSGCLNTVFVASEGVHITTKNTGEGDTFIVHTKNTFALWGNFPKIRIIEVDKVVGAHTGRKVTKITGLRMAQHTTFADGFMSFISLGLYNPRTLIFEGRMVSEELPGPPPVADPPAPPAEEGKDPPEDPGTDDPESKPPPKADPDAASPEKTILDVDAGPPAVLGGPVLNSVK